MNDNYDVIKRRIEKANKALQQFQEHNDDIDTVAALAILESNNKEIRNMLRGYHRSHHYAKIICFLLEDNPNMDRDVIDRYLMINMFLFSHKFIEKFKSFNLIFSLFGVPIIIGAYVYFSNLDVGQAGALIVAIITALILVMVMSLILLILED